MNPTINPIALLETVGRELADGLTEYDDDTRMALVVQEYGRRVTTMRDTFAEACDREHLKVLEVLSEPVLGGKAQRWQLLPEAGSSVEEVMGDIMRMNPRRFSEWRYTRTQILPLLERYGQADLLPNLPDAHHLTPLLREILGDPKEKGGRPLNPEVVNLAKNLVEQSRADSDPDATDAEIREQAVLEVLSSVKESGDSAHRILKTLTEPLMALPGRFEKRGDAYIAVIEIPDEYTLERFAARTGGFVSWRR